MGFSPPRSKQARVGRPHPRYPILTMNKHTCYCVILPSVAHIKLRNHKTAVLQGNELIYRIISLVE